MVTEFIFYITPSCGWHLRAYSNYISCISYQYIITPLHAKNIYPYTMSQNTWFLSLLLLCFSLLSRGRRKIQMLHDLANDGGYVPLKRAPEDRDGWRHRERMSKTCYTAEDYWRWWLLLSEQLDIKLNLLNNFGLVHNMLMKLDIHRKVIGLCTSPCPMRYY